jgi:hypothetical protein
MIYLVSSRLEINFFGNVRNEIETLRMHLEECRQLLGRTGPSRAEIKTQGKLAELSYREEIMWRQQACIQWLPEGDQNTKNSTQKASGRKRRNKILTITRPDG